jgi:thioester reductase-like protein
MTRTAFVTGATGFLGAFFTVRLLRQGFRVFALVRNAPDRSIASIISRIDKQLPGYASDLTENLFCIDGDVRLPDLGLSHEDASRIAAETTEIWHFAATFEDKGGDDNGVFETNVGGTRNLLETLHSYSGPVSLNYVSTAYASPLIGGVASETLASTSHMTGAKNNAYERSKAEAERYVSAFCDEYKMEYRIFRPPIVAGESETGASLGYTGYQGVFRALYLLKRRLEINIGPAFDLDLRLRVIADPDLPVNVVPVDFVTDSMGLLASSPDTAKGIFNITSQQTVTLETLFREASRTLGVTGISLSTSHEFDALPMTMAEQLFRRRMKFQEPYFLNSNTFSSQKFRRHITESEIPSPGCEPEYLAHCNRFCLDDMEQEFSAN